MRYEPVGVPTVVAVPIERLALSTLTRRVLIVTLGLGWQSVKTSAKRSLGGEKLGQKYLRY